MARRVICGNLHRHMARSAGPLYQLLRNEHVHPGGVRRKSARDWRGGATAGGPGRAA
jgi:hypothetical protein